jgi:hypothetical protein
MSTLLLKLLYPFTWNVPQKAEDFLDKKREEIEPELQHEYDKLLQERSEKV